MTSKFLLTIGVTLMIGCAAPVAHAADDDGFGDVFAAATPAALSESNKDFNVVTDAGSLNAIAPAAGGDVAADGAESPPVTDSDAVRAVPGTDRLASPDTPPVPGMVATPGAHGPVAPALTP